MRKIGIEVEYFLFDKDDSIVSPSDYSIPQDECGYLAELRCKPGSSLYETFGFYIAEKKRVFSIIQDVREHKQLVLKSESHMKIPAKMLRGFQRRYGKNISDERNIYHHEFHSLASQHAGMHVHFSHNEERFVQDKSITIYPFYDFIPIIIGMDGKFSKIIKDSKRKPGFYELKPYGFEYRSLPTSMNDDFIFEVIKYAWELFNK
jgi:hypothetical protein